jgi:Uma2 family endonuclease
MLALDPQLHVWTTAEYRAVIETGVFDGRRVELLEGAVVEMSPVGSAHEVVVSLATRALERAFVGAYYVRTQMTLDLSPHSMPLPDVLVVPGTMRDYLDAPPKQCLLLVEVSESSLSYDRTTKASLFALMGIGDYWIVNLQQKRLEVYRDPIEDPRARYGQHYRTVLMLGPTDVIVPLALPDVEIPVRDLLP